MLPVNISFKAFELTYLTSALGRLLQVSRPAANDSNGPEAVIELCRSTVRTRANPVLNEELQFSVTLRIFQ